MSRFFQYGLRYDTSQTIQGDWNRHYGGGFGANEAGLRNMYGGLRFILSGGKSRSNTTQKEELNIQRQTPCMAPSYLIDPVISPSNLETPARLRNLRSPNKQKRNQ